MPVMNLVTTIVCSSWNSDCSASLISRSGLEAVEGDLLGVTAGGLDRSAERGPC